jgi:hypothetical protein
MGRDAEEKKKKKKGRQGVQDLNLGYSILFEGVDIYIDISCNWYYMQYLLSGQSFNKKLLKNSKS